jgi:uncharacterized membrane protein HdeD (DUF308 family)
MMATPATDAAHEPRRDGHVARTNWGWFLFRGLLAIALGVLAMMFPWSALFTFTLVFAAFALADGIASLISGFRGASHHSERWGSLIIRGIAGILIGVLFIALPSLSTFTYAFVALAMVAAWSIITGIFEIVTAARMHREMKGEWLLVIAGVFGILLGLAILYMMWVSPVATIVSVAILIGLYALFAGVVLVIQAFRLKKRAAA